MRHSLTAFLSFFVVGLTIVALEALFLAARFDQFQGQVLGNSELTLSLTQREAAHLYRSVGFTVVWERSRDDWGPPITYQGYELRLR